MADRPQAGQQSWEGEMFRLLVENVRDYAIFVVDDEGRVRSWNPGAERLLGYRAEEVVGQPFDIFFTPEDIRAGVPRREMQQAIAGGRGDDERWHVRKDGSRFWCGGTMTPLWDEGRTLRGFAKIMRDRTEWKRAEDAAREGERLAALEKATERKVVEEEVRFEAHLLDAVGQAAIATDPEGKIIYWNRFAESLYGWSREEVIHRNILEVTPAPDEMKQASEVMARLLSGETCSREFLVRRRDGTTFPVFVTDTPILDDRGRVKAIIGISTDISERKRLEEELRESEGRFRGLMEQAPFSIQVFDPDGRTLRVNRAWEELWGVTLEQIADYNVLHDPQLEKKGIAPYLRRAFAGEPVEIPAIEYDPNETIPDRTRYQDPLRWVSAVAYPLRDDAGRVREVILVHRDITDRKRAEEEQRRLLAALSEADRRKDEFLATLAHELRNPLAPLRNSLQILKMPRVDAATLQQTREMMERQVHHLVRLVDDLLDVARVMRGKIELRREPVELATVVARAVETAKPLIEVQGHRLDITLPPESLLLDADPVRLVQVVGNLLTNAAKYSEANGHIRLTAQREGGRVVLRVRDTGIGIAPDMLAHVFELFVQADHASTKAQGGLGIGLTLVKNLVEMHGGTAEAHSDGLGEGAEFVVRLPLMAGQGRGPNDDADRERREGPKPAPGHRLLVVDDNRDAALSLATLLRLQGHEAHVAHDGPSALELAKSLRPAIVFLDIGMPGMDGYEVARRLRQTPDLERTVLAALTGWGQQEDRRRTAEAGFDHHLVKPPDPKAVESLLASLEKPS